MQNNSNIIKYGYARIVANENLDILQSNKEFKSILAEISACEEVALKEGKLAAFLDREFATTILSRLTSKDCIETVELLSCQNDEGKKAYQLQFEYEEDDADGNRVYDLIIFNTVIENESSEEKIHIEQEKYKILSEISEDIVFEYDYKKDVMRFAEKFKNIFGRDFIMFDCKELLKDRVLNRSRIFIDFTEMFKTLEKGAEVYTGEFRIPTAKGEKRWYSVTATGMRNSEGELIDIVGALRDVDKIKKERQQLVDKSRIDAMTGLLNKGSTEEAITKAIEEMESGCYGVLMMIDIDDFKKVNDYSGHLVGDAVITKLASKLKRTFRSEDVIGRTGGDEFQVYMSNVLDSSIAFDKAKNICEFAKEMFDGTELEGKITVSIGAVCIDKPMKYKELYQKADVALYNAKENGKNRYEVFGQKSSVDRLLADGKNDKEFNAPDINNSIITNCIDILFSRRKLEDNIRSVCEYIGYAFHIDKIVVYEKNEEMTLVRSRFEWDDKGEYKKHQSDQAIPAEMFVALSNENNDEVLYCGDINDLPEEQRIYFAKRGIASMLQCNIVFENRVIGYVDFIEEGIKKVWNQKQIDTLIVIAKLIGEFIIRGNNGALIKSENKERKFALAMRESCDQLVDININKGTFDLYIPKKDGLDSYMNRGNYDDWILENVIQYVAPEYSNQFLDTFLLQSMMRRFASGSNEITMDYVRIKNDTQNWFRRTAVMIYNDDRTRSIVMYVNNIDEHKQIEAEKEKYNKYYDYNNIKDYVKNYSDINDNKDISDKKELGISKYLLEKSEEELKYRATYDLLTGIHNVQTFYEETTEMIKNNPDNRYALIRLDIDKFKLINDIYGFEEGNNVLKYIAKQLAKLTDETDSTCCRVGSDIFCMCMKYDNVDEIIDVIAKVTKEIKDYDISYNIMPFFGVCLVESLVTDISIQCDWANLALKTVKGNRLVNYAMYDNKLRKSLLDERKFESEMEKALSLEQFEMYLQPQYDIATSRIVAAEALVRWNYPDEGVLAPYRFIPIFEKNGFIVKMDEFIWEQACKTIHRWIESGKTPIPISVNVSRIHIYDSELCDKLVKLTDKYQIPRNLLELELTESVYFDDAQTLNRILKDLRDLGFVIAMDDFGSAYSSLNMLENIPVDILKLDRELLVKTENSTQSQTIVKYIIAMAKQLKLKVVAEGVENVEHIMLLLKSSCYIAQGFYYSKPIPLEKFEHIAYSKQGKRKIDERILEFLDRKKNFVDVIYEVDVVTRKIKNYIKEGIEHQLLFDNDIENFDEMQEYLIGICTDEDKVILRNVLNIESCEEKIIKNNGLSAIVRVKKSETNLYNRYDDDNDEGFTKIQFNTIPINYNEGKIESFIVCIKDVTE